MADQRARPIEVMITGAQKAGTTSLFRYLAQHPGVRTHRQAEMTYFVNDREYGRGYPLAYERYFGEIEESEGVLLAKNVMAMYRGEALERLHRHNPEGHVLVMLRNPIDRAYSAYWYARRRGWESIESFEEALAAEPERLKGEWLPWSSCLYLSNGAYHEGIERMLELFGEERLFVTVSDELKKDAAGVLRRVCAKVGLDLDWEPDTKVHYNRSAMARSELFARLFAATLRSTSPVKTLLRTIFPYSVSDRLRSRLLKWNDKSFTPPPIDPETRARLVEHFQPLNERLGALIGRDLSRWNR